MLWAWTVPGWSTKDELRALYRAAVSIEGPGDIAEVGSWKGRSTVVLGRALRDTEADDACVWAIDHHVGSDEEEHRDTLSREGTTLDAFRHNVDAAGVAGRIRPLVMTSLEGAAELARRDVALRMVFIDGAHDEESVRADLRAFFPLVRPGGLIAMHDCESENAVFPGVWRAYQAELEGRVDVAEHTDTLLVVRRPE